VTRESFIPSDLDLDFKSQRHRGPAPGPANEGNVTLLGGALMPLARIDLPNSRTDTGDHKL
jgi:hypothetical protein